MPLQTKPIESIKIQTLFKLKKMTNKFFFPKMDKKYRGSVHFNWRCPLYLLVEIFFFIFYSFFFQKQVKVLHEANIQKRSNIDILINTVKKRVYRQNRKTICILIIWSCILIQNLPHNIIVDDKS